MNRRDLLKRGTAAGTLAAIAACTPKTHSTATSGQPYIGALGVQLYTLRSLFETEAYSTLKSLSDIGFKDLEFAGYYNHNPKEIRRYMDDLGLTSHSSHVQLADVRDNFDTLLEIANFMGQTHLVIPWLAPEERTIDGYKAIAALLNERGAAAEKAGIRMAYHNHDFEFDTLDGIVPYNILLSETEAKYVDMEIDFFWTHKANINPLDLFKAHPGRFFGCHIKDQSPKGTMVSVGQGIIDFDDIFRHTQLAGLKRFYVEHDNPDNPLRSVAQSFKYLSAL